MLKKITSIFLALMLILSFAGCSQSNTDSTAGSNSSPAQESTAAPTDESTEAAGIDVDENLLTVDITLPASIFEGQDMAAFDADAYANEQEFISAKVNEDGSVTVSMTKGKHSELLDEMAASLDSAFAEFVNSEDTPYIKEITHNDDFTTVTMKVDKAAYESAFDFTPFAIGVSVAMYQAFTENEYRVEINIVDVATGDTINTIIYPDALNG